MLAGEKTIGNATPKVIGTAQPSVSAKPNRLSNKTKHIKWYRHIIILQCVINGTLLLAEPLLALML